MKRTNLGERERHREREMEREEERNRERKTEKETERELSNKTTSLRCTSRIKVIELLLLVWWQHFSNQDLSSCPDILLFNETFNTIVFLSLSLIFSFLFLFFLSHLNLLCNSLCLRIPCIPLYFTLHFSSSLFISFTITHPSFSLFLSLILLLSLSLSLPFNWPVKVATHERVRTWLRSPKKSETFPSRQKFLHVVEFFDGIRARSHFCFYVVKSISAWNWPVRKSWCLSCSVENGFVYLAPLSLRDEEKY